MASLALACSSLGAVGLELSLMGLGGGNKVNRQGGKGNEKEDEPGDPR